jgi:hypothetical protein
MLCTFDDPDAAGRRTTRYFEMMGSGAIYREGRQVQRASPGRPLRPARRRGLAAEPDRGQDQLRILATVIGQGRFDKQVPYRFTVNETFDIGCRLLCGQLVRGVVNIPSALMAIRSGTARKGEMSN